MTQKIIPLIIIWSAAIALWSFASPPPGAPGTTNGVIAASNGKIGIGTTTPSYKLDVVGSGAFNQNIYSRATDGGGTRFGLQNTNRHWSISNYGTSVTPNGTFAIADETAGAVRLSIDTTGLVNANNNRLINVGTPIASTDAVNKAYVDGQTGGPNSDKIWGEGRSGTNLLLNTSEQYVANSPGECVNTAYTPNIKIARSRAVTSWEGIPAACPKGWWVCSARDRDLSGGSGATQMASSPGAANNLFGRCGSAVTPVMSCVNADTNFQGGSTPYAFVSDFLYNASSGAYGGVVISSARQVDNPGQGSQQFAIVGTSCSTYAVWCCSY